MELVDNLFLGFAAATSLQNIALGFAGVVLGTLIGVLPGVGPVATIAMLLPLTFAMPPLAALIMLAGIYYGAQYGGSTTAILVNLPGESSSVVTCLDGYQMARQGRAGDALSVAAIGSFIAGCFGTLVIALFGPALADFSQRFSGPEYFSIMILGLILSVALAHGSVLKSVTMVLVGLLLGLVGSDVNTGLLRYTFDIQELSDGINFLPLALGLFGISEIIVNLEKPQARRILSQKIGALWINWNNFKASLPAMLRGTGLGSLLGILPGGGAMLSAFAAYTVEKRIAKDPSRFGKGAIEGVASPEAANNAGAQTSFIPLLTLGIPSNAVMALMMGAMIIQGIVPGPQVMTDQPELFWGLIASMWIGNLLLVVLNLPLISIWVKLLQVPYKFMFPAILVFSCIGTYSVNNSVFEIYLLALFGLAGYIFVKLDCEPAPLLLGFILGPLMEENFRRSLLLSRGDPMVFVERPLSLIILLMALALVLLLVLPAVRRGREVAFKE